MATRRPFGVCIGRFQTFHFGHKKLLDHAIYEANKVCVILGSAKSLPDTKNPFTPKMREEMIRSCYSKEDNERLVFVSVRDYPYSLNMWLMDVRNKALETLECTDFDITLYGYHKDESSFYLKMFPNWIYDEVSPLKLINATSIRERFFLEDNDDWRLLVPTPVFNWMDNYRQTNPLFQELKTELIFEKSYQQKHSFRDATLPYKPVFVTTDAVVIQSGHILLIRRKFNPGKGALALPGGFLQYNKTLEESMLSELKEETEILLPKGILRGAIKECKVFDSPERSLRGRTITSAFLLQLRDNLEDGLPKIKGNDDAAKAFFMPLADLAQHEDQFFEDHYAIIQYFIGRH